jgi:hypothetical protein
MAKTNRQIVEETSRIVRYYILARPIVRGGWQVRAVRLSDDSNMEFDGELIGEYTTKKEAKEQRNRLFNNLKKAR